MKKNILVITGISIAIFSCDSKKDYTCVCTTPDAPPTTSVFTQQTEEEIKKQCDDFYKGNPVATTACKSTAK